MCWSTTARRTVLASNRTEERRALELVVEDRSSDIVEEIGNALLGLLSVKMVPALWVASTYLHGGSTHSRP